MSTTSSFSDGLASHEMLWGRDQLGSVLHALLRAADLVLDEGIGVPPITGETDLDSWMQQSVQRLGCEADGITIPYRDLERELSGCYPALLRIGDRYLAVLREQHGRLQVLCPDTRTRAVSIGEVGEALRRPAEGHGRAEVEALLHRCGVPGRRQARAADLILLDQLGQQAIHHGWLFRAGCSAPLGQWLQQVDAIRNAIALVATHTAAYGLWVLSWAVLGTLSLAGHMDRGWIAGWSLLIASFVGCRVLGTWYQGRIAIGVGGLLKRRLLAGVLRLHAEEIRRQGIGSFLGQTFEAEAIETLALGGGIASLLAMVDILLTGFVLGRAAILLAAWFALSVFLGWRFLLRYQQWTTNRIAMTQDLVESMVGHRTRLVQQKPEAWHEAEDRALQTYYSHSVGLDRVGTVLTGWLPRGWLLLGLTYLVWLVVAGGASHAQIAAILGGILLAWNAFDRLVGSFSEVAAAYVTWQRVGYLFKAAARPELPGTVAAAIASGDSRAGVNLLEVDRLTFRYRTGGAAVLDGCGLAVRTGDRILLEGPSGGGKTTLASLLAGARMPESGLLLAGGLDRQTLGCDGWRKHVTLVPQFHENHLLTETLAFNLLIGRTWPPGPGEMEEAEAVCRGLGLGDVLDRMPNGLLQMLGDGGWQLSHGERSRVFIARALLQDPKLLILDESFGALDPENLQTAMQFTLERANSLMVIAHP